MNSLQIIENQNQRVLLTSQLADVYETDEKVISKNFNNNKGRYTEGKHYYCLQDEGLKEFLQSSNLRMQNQSKIRTIYLWTEKGAMLHAKSLNTDKAWEMYEHLVDNYFTVAKPQKPLSQLELIAMQTNCLIEIDKKVKEQDERLLELGEKFSETSADIHCMEHRLDTALCALAKPCADGWKEEMNRLLNRICTEYQLNFAQFKHSLYEELELLAKCDITARQRNLRERMKKGGSTAKECTAISKLDIVERDEKLRLIFDGIVRRYVADRLTS